MAHSPYRLRTPLIGFGATCGPNPVTAALLHIGRVNPGGNALRLAPVWLIALSFTPFLLPLLLVLLLLPLLLIPSLVVWVPAKAKVPDLGLAPPTPTLGLAHSPERQLALLLLLPAKQLEHPAAQHT